MEITQRSPEWYALRAGRVTASRVADVVAKTKTGVSALRATYMAQLIAERLTGEVEPSYVSPSMQHGIDTEAAARSAYELHSGSLVDEIAFVVHPTVKMAGASPDGLVGDSGLVEIKCPNTATHIDHLLGASIPGKYRTQMLWQMACTGREWCDFVSYDPRLPDELRLFVKRLHRDGVAIAELEREVTVFIREVEQKIKDLRGANIEDFRASVQTAFPGAVAA